MGPECYQVFETSVAKVSAIREVPLEAERGVVKVPTSNLVLFVGSKISGSNRSGKWASVQSLSSH